jgi:geranylgeranyl pyrophosphate synthase
MAQIILNIDSPVSLLRGMKPLSLMDNGFIDDMQHLRDQVLPYMISLTEKNMAVLSDQHSSVYFVKVASKLERAWLTKLAIGIAQPHSSEILPLLAAVELRYLSELVLDDIADNAVERCDVPTLHVQIGTAKAIYVAEVLMSIATENLGEALDIEDISKHMSIIALKSWGQGNIQVNLGQYQSVAYQDVSLDSITPDTVIDLIDRTTGQGLANCFFLGGLIGGANDEQLSQFHKIGQCIGLLMQMRDDLFDYVSNAQLISKEPLLDFKNGQKKLPLVTAYHHSTILEKQEILALMQQSDYSPEDIARIQQLILNPAALAYQANLSNEFIRQIDENLEALDAQSEAAETLRTFVHTYLKLDL